MNTSDPDSRGLLPGEIGKLNKTFTIEALKVEKGILFLLCDTVGYLFQIILAINAIRHRWDPKCEGQTVCACG